MTNTQSKTATTRRRVARLRPLQVSVLEQAWKSRGGAYFCNAVERAAVRLTACVGGRPALLRVAARTRRRSSKAYVLTPAGRRWLAHAKQAACELARTRRFAAASVAAIGSVFVSSFIARS